jgi:hypothetical protein
MFPFTPIHYRLLRYGAEGDEHTLSWRPSLSRAAAGGVVVRPSSKTRRTVYNTTVQIGTEEQSSAVPAREIRGGRSYRRFVLLRL